MYEAFGYLQLLRDACLLHSERVGDISLYYCIYLLLRVARVVKRSKATYSCAEAHASSTASASATYRCPTCLKKKKKLEVIGELAATLLRLYCGFTAASLLLAEN